MPLYVDISEKILEEITSKKQTDLIPAEMELARRYGVSNSTIKKAFARLREMGILCQRPNGRHAVAVAQESGQQQLINLGFLSTLGPSGAPFTGFFERTFTWIRDNLEPNCNLISHNATFDPRAEASFLDKFVRMRVDGLFAFPVISDGRLVNQQLYQTLQKLGTRIFFLHREVREIVSSSFLVDDRKILPLFFNRLAEEGCDHFVMVGDRGTTGLRRNALLEMYYKDNIHSSILRRFSMVPEDVEENVEVLVSDLKELDLSRAGRVGYYCENDYIVYFLRLALKRLVSQDVIVVSDGCERERVYEMLRIPFEERDYSIFHYPRLDYREEEIASQALDCMIRSIESGKEYPETIYFEPRFALD